MKLMKSKSTNSTVPKPAAVKTPAKAPTRPAPVATPAPACVSPATTLIDKASAAPATTSRREISGDFIASRAYSLWEQQGRPHGRDLELWLQAEQLVKQNSQSFAA